LNSFPTGVGIASSASGFCALAAAASKSIGLELSNKKLSSLARRGSGSATRSIFGGFVKWESEFASQLYDEDYWYELRDIVVIIDSNEKKISSRIGMTQTIKTSKKYQERLKNINETINNVEEALKNKNFEKLMKFIMIDSDSMHECMRDTTPSLNYMNEQSFKIRQKLIDLNKEKLIAGYTFDAGPNAHIITKEEYVDLIINEMEKFSSNIIVSKPGSGIIYIDKHLF